MANNVFFSENVKAVVLVGSRDFGRCPTATRLNRALWPVAGVPALQRLLEHLAAQGLRRVVLCCENQSAQTRQHITIPESLEVTFIEETMPRGTAGCIRDAAEPGSDELLMVLPACMLLPPDIKDILDAHRAGQSAMTVFFNPTDGNGQSVQDAQLYLCEPSVLDRIPQKGYFDLKEGLVDAMISADQLVYGATLKRPIASYTHWRQYLQAAALYAEKIAADAALPPGFTSADCGSDVWVGKNVDISPTARIYGPVLIEQDARIESGAVVFGPTIIGKASVIGQDVCIERSVLWDDAVVGPRSHICHSLVDQQRRIPANVMLDNTLAAKPTGSFNAITSALAMRIGRRRSQPIRAEEVAGRQTLGEMLKVAKTRWLVAGSLVLLFGVFVATYWQPTLAQLWRVWLESDEYSSGLLVPFLALYILWARRRSFLDCCVRPAVLGFGLLAAAQIFRLFGLYFMFASAERLAFVVSIGGIVWLVFGWAFFRRFLPIFAFLFLMLPLPNRVETMITLPLQEWATVSAVYSLETLGYSVIRQGNIIQIGETMVAVAEACNGLRMLTAFFVISGFVVLISSRRLWEKATVLIATIPIALLCNTIRLTLTSIAFTMLEAEDLEELFHDFGGLAMMPLAIALIVLLLWLLKVLFNPPETIEHQVVISRSNE